MSSGHIDINTWRNKIFPILIQRFYKKTFNDMDGEFIKTQANTTSIDEAGLFKYKFPIPLKEVKTFIDPDYSLEMLLSWLQRYSKYLSKPEQWLKLEDVMIKLSLAIAPESLNKTLIQEAEFTLDLGKVDLNREVVTVQRKNFLIAALQDRGDSKLLTNIYRPPCEKSVSYIINLSANPSEDGSISMRPNNWEYALDCSVGAGNTYASERGEAYLSYWEYGLGKLKDQTSIKQWEQQQNLVPVSSEQAMSFLKTV